MQHKANNKDLLKGPQGIVIASIPEKLLFFLGYFVHFVRPSVRQSVISLPKRDPTRNTSASSFVTLKYALASNCKLLKLLPKTLITQMKVIRKIFIFKLITSTTTTIAIGRTHTHLGLGEYDTFTGHCSNAIWHPCTYQLWLQLFMIMFHAQFMGIRCGLIREMI